METDRPLETNPPESPEKTAKTATLTYRGKTHEMPAGMTIRDAMKKIGLAPEATLAVLNGALLTDDIQLKAGMKIKLVAVVSGGNW